MIKPDQVPKEVVTAARRALDRSTAVQPYADVIAAALKAWPHAQHRCNAVAYVTLRNGEAVRGEQDVLILPLPPEPRDE